MMQMLSRLLGPEFELKFDLRAGIPPIASDRGQMEQVVLNLVVNARDAMPGGGTIWVRARSATGKDEDAIARMPSPPAEVVVLEVADLRGREAAGPCGRWFRVAQPPANFYDPSGVAVAPIAFDLHGDASSAACAEGSTDSSTTWA